MSKSMLDVTYDYLVEQNREIPFKEIWAHLVEVFALSEEEAASKLAKFYTNMMLDGRFVTLGDNIWDLRSKQTYDKIHIDTNDVYAEEDASEELDEEEIEEDAMLSGEIHSNGDEDDNDEEESEDEDNKDSNDSY